MLLPLHLEDAAASMVGTNTWNNPPSDLRIILIRPKESVICTHRLQALEKCSLSPELGFLNELKKYSVKNKMTKRFY